jgi:prepilin-type N-terminal cleavage/methylation domain-containing protein
MRRGQNKNGLKRRVARGFTIVELLIVIVVIAILAALTVVAFNGVQQRARANAASSSLAQGKKKLELYKVDNSAYPTTGNLANAGVSDGDTSYQYTSDGSTFCLTGTNGTVSYKVTESSSPASGGCAGHGQGGVAAVTNLVTNPSFATGTSGWVAASSATISRVTSPWSLSNGSLQVTPIGQDSFAYSDVPATPGQAYTVLGTVRLEAPQTGSFQGSTQQRNIFFEFRNSGGYLGSGGGTTAVQANATGTYSHRGTGVAPANTTTLRIRLYNGANTGGGSVYWDHIMAVSGSYTGAYGDGSSTDWTWNGTADASTSIGPAS